MKMILEPVTVQNRSTALSLSVAPWQAGLVETVEECLAEAAQLSLWRPVLLCYNGVAVGFAMYGLWPEEGAHGRVWLDRFFIDQRHQGKGYAKPALSAALSHIAQEYNCRTVYLSVYPHNLPAIELYRQFGFSFNGELDSKGEHVMVKQL